MSKLSYHLIDRAAVPPQPRGVLRGARRISSEVPPPPPACRGVAVRPATKLAQLLVYHNAVEPPLPLLDVASDAGLVPFEAVPLPRGRSVEVCRLAELIELCALIQPSHRRLVFDHTTILP